MKYKLLLLLLVFAKGFSQNAVLDTTFGVNGKVTTTFGVGVTLSEIRDILLQPDGKILACGKTGIVANGIFNYELVLVRYLPDGMLDTSFGVNGIVINTQFNECNFVSLILQSNGKIIIGGQVQLIPNTADKAAMLRYNNDGSLDTTFGSNGVVITTIPNNGGSSSLFAHLKTLSDNKILVAYISAVDDVIVLRYDNNGTIDMTFGLNGIFQLNLGNNTSTQSNENVSSIELQSDGKIILGGGTDVNNVPENWDSFLVRVNSDGNIDSSFGTNGVVITDFNGRDGFSNINIINDSIIATGYSFGANNTSKIILAKYTNNGTLDSNFGINGKVITQTTSSNMHDIVLDAILQTDGKIICAGQNGRGFNFDGGTSQSSDMLLLRYNTNGSLDTTFSPTGYVTTSFDSNIFNAGTALSIQNDGNIVVGGSTINLTTGQSFALARYTFDNLGTNSFTNNENFKIAPNPTKDFLTISVNENQKIDEVSVIDCTAKIVYNQKTNSNQINVSSLQNGIYFVKIVAKDKVFEQKFIKE
jgi:uncharacterized delta-60 repeat protein